MEKSIKRVEKLVHVTNSALAQMKFSLMFDDVSGNGEFGSLTKPFDPVLAKTLLDEDDLRHCQREFKAEASEMLANMEAILRPNELPRKQSKAVDKIKEINRRLNNLRLEQTKLDETEQSRKKLQNLLNEEKFSSGFTSSWDSAQSKQGVKEKKPAEAAAPKRTDSLLTVAKSKSKEELKSNILETQDIVNRGFETARQLAQKVETMSKCERKEKTPSTNKTVSEINLRSLDGKAESNETVSTVKCRKCAKRSRRRREFEDVQDQINTGVIEVKRKELERCRRSNLQLQRLPSLHIRGSLQLQKVHNLEIPAGGDAGCVKSNTAVNFLSHEQIENEKRGKMMEKVRRENCCCTAENPRGNYVECFNCGKLIRIRETRVDPRKVDEILQKCNFDVFDPRIEEFVEKCATGTGVNWCKKNQPADVTPLADTAAEPELEITSKKTSRKKKKEQPKKSSPDLQGLTDQLFKKYKQETDTMESRHLKLENILQNLFRRIDESRDVFEKCHFFNSKRSDDGTPPKLTVTKPVVVSLTESPRRGRTKHRQLSKQEIHKRKKSRSDSEKSKVGVQKPRETKSTEKEKTSGRISLICAKPNGKNKMGTKKETSERFAASSSDSEKPREVGKVEEAASPGTSSSTSQSWNSKQSKRVFGKRIEETLVSMPYRNSKPSDRYIRLEETQKQFSSLSKNKTIIQPVAEEKAPSESSSSTSSKSRRTGPVDDIPKPKPPESSQSLTSVRGDEVKGQTSPAFPTKSEEKSNSESSSDDSENNYESDFESMTNEPNENTEEGDPELNADENKLSTISEVDSELEKKLSDEQKTVRSSLNVDDASKTSEEERKDTKTHDRDIGQPKEDNSPVEIFPESKQTEATSPRTTETCSKSSPTELVTSLKDILSALQDQFVRTESLAEKLTENVKSEGLGKPDPGLPLLGEVMLAKWKPLGTELVENLRSARKGSSLEPKSPRRGRKSGSERSRKSGELSEDSLSDEGGSSLGEIIVSDRRRKTSGSSSISECSFLRLDSVRKAAPNRREASATSAFKLEVKSEEILYSEGEIPDDEVSALERFRTTSLGEVVSGKNSAASTVD